MWGDLAGVIRAFLDAVPDDRLSTEFHTEVAVCLPVSSTKALRDGITKTSREILAARTSMTTAPPYRVTDDLTQPPSGGTATALPSRDSSALND
jgi:hypothetical protein